MTNRVSVPKRLMQRFFAQPPLLFRKRQGRKLVIRSGKKTQASTVDESSEWGLEIQEASRIPAAIPTPKQQLQVNQPHDSLPKPKKRFPGRRRKALRWSLLWLSVLSILGLSLTAGVLFLTKLPPPVNCRNIPLLASDSERLYCAQRAAESGKLESLVAAIKVVQNWTSDHPLYPEAQRHLKVWSEAILSLSRQKIKRGDLLAAMTTARNIPNSSPMYAEAQTAIATWQKQWQKGEATKSKITAALVARNWSLASQLIGQLSNTEQPYWTSARIQALMQQLSAEKLAWQQLEQARDLTKTNRLEQLNEAIALVSKINPNSYVKALAQKEQTGWCRTLLKLAAINFKNQNFPNVIQLLSRIPINTPLYQEAQDWMQLARASQTVKNNHILAFLDAIAAVQQIQPDSPIHQLAEKKAAVWESQLQGSMQLQLASLSANLEQKASFNYAIDQAQKVAPGHPDRLLAQTLIAQWRKEIQQIEDRTKLIEAQELAEKGTIAELKNAVQLASLIKPNQPLRLEAQAGIAQWQRQIQTIEDQPILELAQTFAQRQDLTAAISTAEQIRSGRALYAEAQKAIAIWVAQVQTAQDRPILEAASALAMQGRLDAAIATAAQIPPQRALYQQAQSAIEVWRSQKAALSDEVPLIDPVPGGEE